MRSDGRRAAKEPRRKDGREHIKKGGKEVFNPANIALSMKAVF